MCFDVVHAEQHYDGGAEAAVRAFAAESGNLAFPISRHILGERFSDERAKAPVDYTRFCLGDAPSAGSEEDRFHRAALANDAVTVAQALLSGSH